MLVAAVVVSELAGLEVLVVMAVVALVRKRMTLLEPLVLQTQAAVVAAAQRQAVARLQGLLVALVS